MSLGLCRHSHEVLRYADNRPWERIFKWQLPMKSLCKDAFWASRFNGCRLFQNTVVPTISKFIMEEKSIIAVCAF